MSYSAFESVTDAIDATRDFLFDPLFVRRWLALALVVFFAGGVGGGFNPLSLANSGQGATSDPGTGGEDFTPEQAWSELTTFLQEHTTEVLLVGGALIALWLAFWILGAIMEFVFVQSLREEAVRIRTFWSRHFGDGLRVFAFEAAVGLVSLATLGLVALVGYGWYVGAWWGGPGAIALALLVALPLLLVTSLVGWFTRTFVVPVMILEDRGVISAWRRLLGVLRREWAEYLLYVVVAWLLNMALATVVGVVVGIVAFVLAIPLVLLVLSLAVGTGPGLVTLAGLGVAVVAYVLVLLVLGAVVNVPFASYLRYYELLVLGDTDGRLDAIPGIRRRVRGGGEVGGTDAGAA